MRERDVAVLRFARHIAAQPIGPLEFRGAFLIVEFYFGNDQAVMPATIDIDLDRMLFPWNVVAHLRQTPAGRGGPECLELFEAQANLALLAPASRSFLVGERKHGALLSQSHLEAAASHRQITLL